MHGMGMWPIEPALCRAQVRRGCSNSHRRRKREVGKPQRAAEHWIAARFMNRAAIQQRSVASSCSRRPAGPANHITSVHQRTCS
jgi:hypothetical protein